MDGAIKIPILFGNFPLLLDKVSSKTEKSTLNLHSVVIAVANRKKMQLYLVIIFRVPFLIVGSFFYRKFCRPSRCLNFSINNVLTAVVIRCDVIKIVRESRFTRNPIIMLSIGYSGCFGSLCVCY
jgi:hypothetical protein